MGPVPVYVPDYQGFLYADLPNGILPPDGYTGTIFDALADAIKAQIEPRRTAPAMTTASEWRVRRRFAVRPEILQRSSPRADIGYRAQATGAGCCCLKAAIVNGDPGPVLSHPSKT